MNKLENLEKRQNGRPTARSITDLSTSNRGDVVLLDPKKVCLTDRRSTFGYKHSAYENQFFENDYDSKSANFANDGKKGYLHAIDARSFKDIRPEFEFMDQMAKMKNLNLKNSSAMKKKRNNFKIAKMGNANA